MEWISRKTSIAGVQIPNWALQVDGRFLTKKLTDLTTDEIRALEERVEMIEPEQGVLALTHGTESRKAGNVKS